MNESVLLGVIIGVGIASMLWALDRQCYKSILASIGDVGGREKINGKWYKIELLGEEPAE